MPDVTASSGKSLDFTASLGIFIHCLISELFLLHQTCTDGVSNYTFWYVNMPNVTACYGL